MTLDELAAHVGRADLPDRRPRRAGRASSCRSGQRAKAEALMARLARAYPDRLYVELQRHPGETGQLPEAERLTERGFIEMAYAMGLPLVATNDVYFPKPELYEAHDALICIAEGAYVDQQEPRRRLTPQHYFKIAAGDGRRCSPICPRRSRTPSRSPGAAPSRSPSATRSCRNSPMTRSRNCAARPGTGLARAARGHPPRRAGGGLRGAAGIRARHHRAAWAFPATS